MFPAFRGDELACDGDDHPVALSATALADVARAPELADVAKALELAEAADDSRDAAGERRPSARAQSTTAHAESDAPVTVVATAFEWPTLGRTCTSTSTSFTFTRGSTTGGRTPARPTTMQYNEAVAAALDRILEFTVGRECETSY